MNDDKDTEEIVPGSSIDKVVVQEDGKASNVDEEKITIDQKVAPINENENDPVYVQCKEIILSSSPKIQDNLEAQEIVEEKPKESHKNVDNKASGKNHLEKLMAALQSPDDVYCLQL